MSFSLAFVLAAATPFTDLDAIDAHVARFTGAAIGQPGGAMQPVDRRLRLNACSSPFGLAWRTQQRQTVVVQCPDPGGWRLFVPVANGGEPSRPLPPAINRGDGVSIAVSGDGFTVSQPGEALENGAVGAWIRVRLAKRGSGLLGDEMRARVVRPGLVSIPMP